MSSDNPASTVSLQSALHAATRTCHSNLNKTITARLPLCLPPYASDPTAYYFGMLMFGHMYLTFEQAINQVSAENPNDNESRTRHIRLLQTLNTERLPRTEALNEDLRILSDNLRLQNPAIASMEAKVQKQALESTHHILKNIDTKPHLALAYTWTLYLALFNGGRWLYKQLASPGHGFWLEQAEQDGNIIRALSFWRFETSPQDPQAEELKLEFKGKFEEASKLLTDKEGEEVVAEAVQLFELCLRLIDGLDVIMADMNHNSQQKFTQATASTTTAAATGLMSTMWQTLSFNLLAPAYRMLSSEWPRPIREELRAVD